MRPRSLLRAVIHTFASLITGQGAQIALGVAVGRMLGPAVKGDVSLAQALVTFAIVAGDGIRTGIAAEVRQRGEDLRELWGASLALLLLAATIGSAILATLAALHPLQPAYRYAAVAFPCVLFTQVVNLLWSMRDRIETFNVRMTLTAGAGSAVAGIVAVLAFHAGVDVVLGLWTLGFVLSALWSATEIGQFIGGSPLLPARALLHAQTGFTAKAALSSLATMLVRRIDIFIVGALAPPAVFGIYTVAVATGEVIFQVSNSLTWATTGRIVTLPLPAASELTARLIRTLLISQLAVALPLMLAGPWLISHVYGPRFDAAGVPLRLLLPGVVLYSADTLLSFYLSARLGRPGLLVAYETFSLALCATATTAGFLRFGIAGAAAANTLTYAISYAAKVTFFARQAGLDARAIFVPRWSDIPDALRVRFRGSSPTRP